MIRTITLSLLLSFIFTPAVISQKSDFIQIETNKTLCIFSFLETAKHARGTSSSFRQFIQQELGQNEQFTALVDRYAAIKLNDQFRKEGYPENRHPYRDVKDLLWIASSNSTDISDFSERIVGLLANSSHQELIDIMTDIAPFYEELIWNKEQANIKRIEEQLSPYTSKIEALFLQVSNFYGASWSKKIPFKIMLYPIPLERGNTTAIPKGNALICSFLSRNEKDFEGRLGVIVHEMCHILYDEQPLALQHELEASFMGSTSEWAKLAYSYIDEGLATAIGNGWAYEQIHGELDTMSWYNNPYIDGFAHTLFPLVSSYIDQGKQMDKAFVKAAISSFEKKFPEAIREVDILMNELTLFANSEEEKELDFISDTMRYNFNIRSQWFSTPIADPNSAKHLSKKQTTKFFIIEKDQQASLSYIQSQFPDMERDLDPKNQFLYCFKDTQTKSAVIILNLHSLEGLAEGLLKLREAKFLSLDKVQTF